MPGLNPKRARRLKRVLNLVPFLANNPGVPVKTVCDVFGLGRGEFMEAVHEMLLFGTPPYSPMDYVTVWVEKGRVTLVNADFLTKPLRLTVAEAVSLKVMIDDFLRQSPGVFEEEAGSLGAKVDGILGRRAPEIGRTSSARGKMSVLEQALAESRSVRISWYNRAEDAITERTVDPLAIVDIEGLWYLVGYCHLRGAQRAFRTDRIREAALLDEHFERPEGFDLRKYRKSEMFFPTGSEKPARVRFSAECSRWAGERFGNRIVERRRDGVVVCEFPVADATWISDLVVEYAPEATLLGPKDVKREFRKRLDAILALYS